MSTIRSILNPQPASGGTPGGRAARRRARTAVSIILAVLVSLLALLGARAGWGHGSGATRAMPQSSAMESALGVRFSRIAVVGDGGLVTLSYLVLDLDKAARFQGDTKHPPVLHSDARDGGTNRVSIMRQGHINRAGATYYFVYQNTGGALRPGEDATISYGGLRLEHVPVL